MTIWPNLIFQFTLIHPSNYFKYIFDLFCEHVSQLQVKTLPICQIQKSGVLRKAIEHINGLQSTIQKLKYDNVQLKKKQDILEQNNSVLTMKLAEQGATVVYLEKTPGMCLLLGRGGGQNVTLWGRVQGGGAKRYIMGEGPGGGQNVTLWGRVRGGGGGAKRYNIMGEGPGLSSISL